MKNSTRWRLAIAAFSGLFAALLTSWRQSHIEYDKWLRARDDENNKWLQLREDERRKDIRLAMVRFLLFLGVQKISQPPDCLTCCLFTCN
ncbi:hypothetical protein [Scytonema sp. NUACC26]|uniref:hypothetical protein n=1 Tax=Scytonema sp. NUACC26 TaxID=3140176 RepID=UPI0038B3EB35